MIKLYKKYDKLQLSDHFNLEEFHCHCTYDLCTFTYIDTDLINYLEKKRKELKNKIKVISGFRCNRHNEDVGGKKGSFHLIGKAADIIFIGKNILDFSDLFQDADGLGIYHKEHFLHVDVRGYRARWVE